MEVENTYLFEDPVDFDAFTTVVDELVEERFSGYEQLYPDEDMERLRAHGVQAEGYQRGAEEMVAGPLDTLFGHGHKVYVYAAEADVVDAFSVRHGMRFSLYPFLGGRALERTKEFVADVYRRLDREPPNL